MPCLSSCWFEAYRPEVSRIIAVLEGCEWRIPHVQQRVYGHRQARDGKYDARPTTNTLANEAKISAFRVRKAQAIPLFLLQCAPL